jgi:predicted transcriptional regulator
MMRDYEQILADLRNTAETDWPVEAAEALEEIELVESLQRKVEELEASRTAEPSRSGAYDFQTCNMDERTNEEKIRDLDELDRKTGAEWRENSSLEKWFPFTASELATLRTQLASQQELIDQWEVLSLVDLLEKNRALVAQLAGQPVAQSR